MKCLEIAREGRALQVLYEEGRGGPLGGKFLPSLPTSVNTGKI